MFSLECTYQKHTTHGSIMRGSFKGFNGPMHKPLHRQFINNE